MDEPLSNLDAKLRVQTRAEISKLHEQLATTFIYVTHDQTEAMTMADRIVIMNNGVIQQVDTPINVYSKPENLFVATFIGSPQMNLISGKIIKEDEDYYMENENVKFYISQEKALKLQDLGYLSKDIVCGIRPEHIYDGFRKTNSTLIGKVDFVELLGAQQYAYITVSYTHLHLVKKLKKIKFHYLHILQQDILTHSHLQCSTTLVEMNYLIS